MVLIKPTGRSFSDREKEADNAARKHLEPGELAALWKALAPDPFWNGYFRLQYHFGCRCSEVAILLKEDVDLKGKRIIISRLKKKEKKTRGGVTAAGGFTRHPYPLSVGLVKHLSAVAVPDENPWFFGSRHRAREGERAERMANIRITDGGWRAVSRSSAQTRFVEAARAAGVPLSLRHTHVMRHTRATLLFARGHTEGQVQYLLAHTSPVITRQYMGWADSLKKKASVALMLDEEDE